MKIFDEHGLSIGISRVDNFFFMKMKIKGTLTHEDYKMMVPLLRESIHSVNQPKIKVLIDATEFNGWEARAIWDDFKFGIEFKDFFTKIAFIGNKSWEKYGAKIGNWFMNGELKYFNSDIDAYEWINQDEISPTTPVEKDLSNRKDSIKDELESLFKSNLRVTDFNVPEADDQNASEMIISILEEKLADIKNDVSKGKYKDY